MNTIQDFFRLGMDRLIPDLRTPPPGKVLNLGAGNKIIHDAIPLDYPEWDADVMPIPFGNGTVSMIHAYHFLEHLRDPVGMLVECQRVLRPGGIMNIVVPYYNAQIMAQDLDHKHAFSEQTWKTLFKNQYYNKNRIEWKWEVGVNIIIGIVEHNLCLMTQLIRKDD